MSSAAGWTLLAFGAFGAICAGTGVRRWSRQDAVAMWWFAFGLIGTELVVPMMVLGVACGTLLIGLGALDTGPGRVGLALTLFAVALRPHIQLGRYAAVAQRRHSGNLRNTASVRPDKCCLDAVLAQPMT